jgi:hypothetical protein
MFQYSISPVGPQMPELLRRAGGALLRGEVLYLWKARESLRRGSGGVTDRGDLATARLIDALRMLAPGATGSVECVCLDRAARVPSYHHGLVLLEIRRDEITGAIVVDGDG